MVAAVGPTAAEAVAEASVLLRPRSVRKVTGTAVEAVKATNGLRGNRIFPGQLLQLPSAQ